jgi:hypothetical protein
MRFDTEKKTPTMGRSSKTAAQNPKAEGMNYQHDRVSRGERTRLTSVVPFAFFDEGCNLRFRHPLGLKVLEAFELANFEYGTV